MTPEDQGYIHVSLMCKTHQFTEISITQCLLFKHILHQFVIQVKYTPLMPLNFSQNMFLTFNWYIPYNREKPWGENPYKEKSKNFFAPVEKSPTPFLTLCIKPFFK